MGYMEHTIAVDQQALSLSKGMAVLQNSAHLIWTIAIISINFQLSSIDVGMQVTQSSQTGVGTIAMVLFNEAGVATGMHIRSAIGQVFDDASNLVIDSTGINVQIAAGDITNVASSTESLVVSGIVATGANDPKATSFIVRSDVGVIFVDSADVVIQDKNGALNGITKTVVEKNTINSVQPKLFPRGNCPDNSTEFDYTCDDGNDPLYTLSIVGCCESSYLKCPSKCNSRSNQFNNGKKTCTCSGCSATNSVIASSTFSTSSIGNSFSFLSFGFSSSSSSSSSSSYGGSFSFMSKASSKMLSFTSNLNSQDSSSLTRADIFEAKRIRQDLASSFFQICSGTNSSSLVTSFSSSSSSSSNVGSSTSLRSRASFRSLSSSSASGPVSDDPIFGATLSGVNETAAAEAFEAIATIVQEPGQNSVATQAMTSLFLRRELQQLAWQSQKKNNIEKISREALNSATSATANLMESLYRSVTSFKDGNQNETSLSLEDAQAISVQLSAGASALSIIQLREQGPNDPPVVSQSGPLTVSSKRHNLDSIFDVGTGTAGDQQDSDVSTDDVTFSVPPLPSALRESLDVSDSIDTSLVQWEVSPWAFEAGRVHSFVAGLTFTVPSQENRKLEVHSLTNEISIILPRKFPDNSTNSSNYGDDGSTEFTETFSSTSTSTSTSTKGDHKSTKNTSTYTAIDVCVYMNETYIDAENTTLHEWSSSGCRVDYNATNATHVVCLCNHLTDFGSRLGKSFESFGRVVGQLDDSDSTEGSSKDYRNGSGGIGNETYDHSSMSLGEKALANLVTIAIMASVLVFSILSCAFGTELEKRKRVKRRLLVEKLTKSLPLKRNRRQSYKQSNSAPINANVDDREEQIAQEHRVVHMLSRDFWDDEHMRTLVNCVNDQIPPIRRDVTNLSKMLAMSEEAKHEERLLEARTDSKKTRIFATASKRMWAMFVRVLKREHEWVAPFYVTGIDRFFTVASRVLLLTVVLLTQMFTEALLFDFRFPESGGTCTASTVYKTFINVTSYNVTSYNVTSVDNQMSSYQNSTNSTFEKSNFGPPPSLTIGDKIGLSFVTVLLNAPLAACVCVLFLKLAMAKKNEHLWERLGIDQLRDTLVTRERDTKARFLEEKRNSSTVRTSLVSCGGVSYMEKTWKHKDKRGTYDTFTLTVVTSMTSGTNKEGHNCITLKNNGQNKTFSFPVGPTQDDIDRWMDAIRVTIDVLPTHKHALQSVKEATAGQLRHLKRRVFVSKVDNVASARLQTYSKALLNHANEQLNIVVPLDSEHDKHVVRRLRESGKVFRHDDTWFEREIRSLMLVEVDLLVEEEEDDGGRRLQSCICRFCFQFSVEEERHDLGVQSDVCVRTAIKWGSYIFLSIWSFACAFYVILFGFCHGQRATLAWMEILLSQILLSAFLCRPLTIMMLKAVLPTMCIETGLALPEIVSKEEDKEEHASSSSVVVEMTSMLKEEEEYSSTNEVEF